MLVIETQDLTKIYETGLKKGNITALNGLSIGIEAGEIFGLLGPNGAGKTTLVKILLNITKATSGSVMINGLDPSDPRSRARVGFLPENHRFPTHLTGKGLLMLAGRLHGMSDTEIKEKLSELLELVGMKRWADTMITKYSKGMAQRIGLAQALIADPDLILLDEPTDGVDPVGKAEIKTVLQKLRSRGKTILLNSHMLSEVEMIADRVAIMNKGKVIKVGSVDDFTKRAMRYEIEAEIGNERFTIPEEVGKLVTIKTNMMTVDLTHIDQLNTIIDQLRTKRIAIRSIQPTRISLEQSFIDTIEGTGGTSV